MSKEDALIRHLGLNVSSGYVQCPRHRSKLQSAKSKRHRGHEDGTMQAEAGGKSE